MLANAIPIPSGDAADQPIQPPDPPVQEVRSVCTGHGVSGNSLDQFLETLHTNKHFAMDFWSLIARVSDQPGAATAGPDWLLAAVVEAVTGQNLADARAASPAQQLQVKKVASMLAGEDVNPLPPEPAHAPASLDRSDQPGPLLKPETPFAAAMERSLREQDSKRTIAIPLAAYAQQDDHRIVSRGFVIGLLLLVLAAAALLLLHFSSPSGLAGIGASIGDQYDSAVAAWKEHSQSQAPPAGNPDRAPFNPTASAGSADSTAPTAPQAGSAAIPVTPPLASTAATNAGPQKATQTEAPVVVPESVMKLNLISSRVPIFPEGAQADEPVVLQAIVTKHGAVEPVRVLRGDPAFGRAAMAAVSAWRYRPYLQNGVPVTVSTTISVDSTGSN